MNTRTQTGAWAYRIVVVLALMLATSLAGILTFTLVKRSVPELLFVLGSVAASGLARLAIPSLWSRWRLE